MAKSLNKAEDQQDTSTPTTRMGHRHESVSERMERYEESESDRAEKDSISQVASGARDAGITAVVVIMVLFIRIMAVSGWNWDTAADIADAFNFDDSVPILFGTLFELPLMTGLAAAIILPLACYRLYLIYQRHDRSAQTADWFVIMILGIMLFVLWNTYDMWWPTVVALVWGASIAIFAFLVHKGETLQILDAVSRKTGTLFIITILVMSVVVTTPWNPLEEIGLTDGSVVEAHVIESSPGFVRVLTEDRQVELIALNDISYRKTVDIPEPGESD